MSLINDKECADCGATGTNVLGFSCPHKFCPIFSEEEQTPCPVCGNEERGQGGYLTCECPAQANTARLPISPDRKTAEKHIREMTEASRFALPAKREDY